MNVLGTQFCAAHAMRAMVKQGTGGAIVTVVAGARRRSVTGRIVRFDGTQLSGHAAEQLTPVPLLEPRDPRHNAAALTAQYR